MFLGLMELLMGMRMRRVEISGRSVVVWMVEITSWACVRTHASPSRRPSRQPFEKRPSESVLVPLGLACSGDDCLYSAPG